MSERYVLTVKGIAAVACSDARQGRCARPARFGRWAGLYLQHYLAALALPPAAA